jgi:predicted nucleotidyltransferase
MGTSNDTGRLGAYLFNKTRRGLLTLLYNRPGEAFYVNQIVEVLKSGSGAVQRELGMMTDAGIVVREKQGNLVFYRANPESPIYNELKSIIEKTAPASAKSNDFVAQRFKITGTQLADFCRKHHINKLSLYGPVLHEEFSPESPINVLVEFQPDHAPGFGMADIEDELSRLAEWRVNLRTPGDLSRYIRVEVAREARVMYAASRPKK